MAVRLDLGYRSTFIIDDVADAAVIMKLLAKARCVKECTDKWLDAQYEEHYDRVYVLDTDSDIRYVNMARVPVVMDQEEFDALCARRVQEREQLTQLKLEQDAGAASNANDSSDE